MFNLFYSIFKRKTFLLKFVIQLLMIISFIELSNAGSCGSNTCLGSPKGIPGLYFDNTQCVDSDPNSTYFKPTVIIRYRVCFFDCWCDQKTLSAWGECDWMYSIRFCARATAPSNSEQLANKQSSNGNSTGLAGYGPARVQVCGFQDSCDFMDTNGCLIGNKGYMPFHRNSANPYYNNQAATAADALGASAIASLGVLPGASVYLAIAGGVAALADKIQQTVNHVVISELGCVDIPSAPAPPPFCPTLTPTKPQAIVERICEENEISVLSNPCVKTDARINELKLNASSFERSLIRVGFNNIIPICSSEANADPCVRIYYPANQASSVIHNNYNDLIPICDANKTAPCVEFINSIIKGGSLYRVVYQYRIGSKAAITNWVDTNDVNNQPLLYGVNNAGFADLSYYYRCAFSDNYQLSSCAVPSLSKQIFDTLTNSNSRLFSTNIDLNNNKQICVNEDTNNNKLIGCVDRPAMSKPIVTRCGVQQCDTSGNFCIPDTACSDKNLTSSNTKPKIVVGIGSNKDNFLYGIIGNGNSYNTNSPANLYLHGVNLTSIITDDNYTMPTASDCDANDNCNIRGNFDTNNLYIGGLQYKNKQYYRGATKICLNGFNNKENVIALLDQNSIPSQVLNQRVYPNYQSDSQVLAVDSYIPNQTKICYTNRHYPIPTSNSWCNSCDQSWWGTVTFSQCTNDNQQDLAKMLNSYDGKNTAPFEGIRNKTAWELGLCVDVPPPNGCLASNSGSATEGYATWPQANVGDSVIGSCIDNYQTSGSTAIGSLNQFCNRYGLLSSEGAPTARCITIYQDAQKKASGQPMRTCYPQEDHGDFGPVANPCLKN